jgi:hypothetical protein
MGLPRREAGERTISVIEGDELMLPVPCFTSRFAAVRND